MLNNKNWHITMNVINDAHPLTDLPIPIGLTVWPKVVGHLTSLTGVHYQLGNYTCIHIIEKGRGWINSGKHTKEVKPGDMFSIMENGQIEYYDDPADPWDFYWIHLLGDSVDTFVRAWGFTPEEPWFTPEKPSRILECFKKIYAMVSAPSLPRSYALATELFNLADAIYNPEPYEKSKSKQLYDRALAIIDSQLHTAINVSELATALNVDRTTLFHAFRKECGNSPVDVIREQRIERACSLLASSNRTIADIARICGFSNDKYFIKTFRQLKGTSPRKYVN